MGLTLPLFTHLAPLLWATKRLAILALSLLRLAVCYSFPTYKMGQLESRFLADSRTAGIKGTNMNYKPFGGQAPIPPGNPVGEVQSSAPHDSLGN